MTARPSDELEIITLVGAFGIQDGDTHKPVLLAALDAGRPVALDVTGLTKIDTAGLQLMCALARDLRERGRSLQWVGQSKPLCDAARTLGLLEALGLQHATPTGEEQGGR